jgi:hypothetical protein
MYPHKQTQKIVKQDNMVTTQTETHLHTKAAGKDFDDMTTTNKLLVLPVARI